MRQWREERGVASAETKLAVFIGALIALQESPEPVTLQVALREAAKRARIELRVEPLGAVNGAARRFPCDRAQVYADGPNGMRCSVCDGSAERGCQVIS